MKKTVLITGVAGFIGSGLAKRVLHDGEYSVVGVDNLNDYYDIELKKSRLKLLDSADIHIIDIADEEGMEKVFQEYQIDIVVNLAAQAGVRYAKENPDSYVHSNVQGLFNVAKLAVRYGVERILYASSSSVYGSTTEMPFRESMRCDSPMSLYAATKISNEAFAASFFFTYGIKVIGMRFFNVYGPWGRPDMAYFKWLDAMMKDKEIEVRNGGEMWRDMTYIDDVIESILRLCKLENDLTSPQIYNIGNRSPIKIMDVVDYLGLSVGIEPKITFKEKGDEEPIKTWADTTKLHDATGFSPDTKLEVGLNAFIKWYKEFYGI